MASITISKDGRVPGRVGVWFRRGLAGYPMRHGHIQIHDEQLADFCRRNHISKLALFGSVLRDDFDTHSDVDVLVEFEPDYPVGLIRLARMERELSELIGRKVDMRTPADLSRYFRDEVVRSAKVQYAAR